MIHHTCNSQVVIDSASIKIIFWEPCLHLLWIPRSENSIFLPGSEFLCFYRKNAHQVVLQMKLAICLDPSSPIILFLITSSSSIKSGLEQKGSTTGNISLLPIRLLQKSYILGLHISQSWYLIDPNIACYSRKLYLNAMSYPIKQDTVI